jgi:general secretion pathway protein A
MGYEQFFGLHDAPFGLAPNPRYLFESASHAQALQQLAYAIDRREPLVVVTGEIGTGKTLLCRTVLQRLNRRTFISVIHNPQLERDDLLKQMLQDFGVLSVDRTTAAVTSRHDLVHALEDFLTSLIFLDAHAVVVIDEAQLVMPDVLEQIRLLSNIDAPSGTKLQIMLAGQLDLETMLAKPEMRQFQQRVSRRIRLEPLTRNELGPYIAHRLAVGKAAGSQMPGAGDLARSLSQWEGAGQNAGVTFSPEAVDAVWRLSSGVPRVVNLLCDRALEAAFAKQAHVVDAGLIEVADTALKPAAAVPVPQPAATAPPPPQAAKPAELPDADLAPPVLTGNSAIPPPLELTTGSRARWNLIAIPIVIAAAAGVWYVTQRQAPPAPAPAATAPIVKPPVPASVEPPAPAPSDTAPAPAASPQAAPAAKPAPPAAAPAAAGFEILVASFRTEERAAAVSEQVTKAGLTVRRRAAGGWQQVIAGPFASREDADAARARLDRAGLSGTQIVAADR